MVRVKTRSPATAGIGAAVLMSTVLATAYPAQAQGLQTPRLPPPPGHRIQLAGLFDWLKNKQAPAPAPAPQTWQPQLTPAPQRPPGQGAPARRPRAAPPTGGGTYRTLCVRTCDGYYFPISFKATRSKFKSDSVACRNRCGGGDARLFVHRNPGQEVNRAVDLEGNRYVDQENAFRYRKELVAGCGCDSSSLAETGSDAQ